MSEYAGMITGGNGSYTHWRSNLALDVRRGWWSGSWSTQYIGPADDINTDSGPGSSVDAAFYHNLQASYQVTEEIEVSFGIDNVFDEDAPFVASWRMRTPTP